MRVGCVKEIKTLEFRVGMTPGLARELVTHGHEVLIETKAGAGIGIADSEYIAAGAKILPDPKAVFAASDMIVKVKEPQASEIALLEPRHILFTYLHLAADPEQAEGLQKSGATCIAYETVVGRDGGLPLLAPMSQVAGRMATMVGATALLKPAGGRGLLVSGVPGVRPAKVLILGGGVSGTHAAEMAVGLRADVTIFEKSAKRLGELDVQFAGEAKCVFSTGDAIEAALPDADLVIGCVLIPGAAAPKLVRREHLKVMKPGSVLVDVSIDQGGCFETSHPTTHAQPTFEVEGVVHYCVANMPGAAPLTSTFALVAVTSPYVMALAEKGVDQALAEDPGFAKGLNIRDGRITHPAVVEALNQAA
jgi:alanine dehydrogenase